MKKIFKIVIILFILNFISLPFFSPFAQAAGATLFLSPASGEYNVGDSFNVNILINSGGGEGINASDAVVKFDEKFLLVNKISKGSSIFNLWTSEPTFSNKNGTISYSGGLPSGPGKGYKGTSGVVISITFTSLQAGETSVGFSSGSVLANDGLGTNILSASNGAKYTFNVKKEEPKPEPKPESEPKPEPKAEEQTGVLPPPPKVESTTHPDENIWYQNNSLVFSWKLLIDVSGVSYALNNSSSTDPGKVSQGIVESKKYEDVEDGVNYFHIKFQNNNGWGPITHRAVLIDGTNPLDFEIIVDDEGDPTNPSPYVSFSVIDKASGIKNYTITLDGVNSEITEEDMKRNPYEFPNLKPGQHIFEVIAYDYAGNNASTSKTFLVEALKAPVITEMSKTLIKGDELIIQGTSFYPNALIKIYLLEDAGDKNNEPIEIEVKTDEDGNWTYFRQNDLKKGVYRVWAKVIDSRGAESYDSLKKTLTVKAPSIICAYGFWIILFLILVIIGLIAAIVYIDYMHKRQKQRAIRESQELEKRLAEIFIALKEEVNELMEFADKKSGISESELRIKDKINEALDISQEFIGKEIKDVKKEIE